MAKKNLAWIRDCIAHWSQTVFETDLGVDWSDAETRCWRCGTERSLQRCHIVAKQFSGSDDASNIVPLCCECHDEAPDVTDASEIWRWIRDTRPKYGYGTLKFERAVEIAVRRGADLGRFDQERFASIMEDHVGLHLMQNGTGCRIKATSVAWAIEQSCKEATDGI
jgi:hypothetical protein